jgi:hypothetical protein
MTLFLCKKHGRQGFIEVCEHINSELSSNIFCENKPLTFWSNVYACDACWQNFEIDKFENHPELKGKEYSNIDDGFDENGLAFKGYYEVYNQLNRNTWCAKCVAEIQSKSK